VRILVIHNRYQQRGGEDAVFEDETRLLSERGHEVRTLVRSNDSLAAQGRLRAACNALWSHNSAQAVGQVLDSWAPDLMHVHNTFAVLSPSVLSAATRRKVAVVATLHNFRLACLEGTFMREGQTCQDCLGRAPIKGVLLGCYRGSCAQSAVLAASTLLHRGLGTWRHHVHRFIALNEQSVAAYVAAGLPAERLRVKPNFAWPAPAVLGDPVRHGGLYVGRLAQEKGIKVLAHALSMRHGSGSTVPFTVIGTGPEASLLSNLEVSMLGQQDSVAVQANMQRASYLVLPSVAQEQFPRVLAEAFAAGLPVIAAARGALQYLVQHGQTGLLFAPGDPAALAAQLASRVGAHGASRAG
jgi:glycosyltransferase involved in cell wall biosynthesis